MFLNIILTVFGLKNNIIFAIITSTKPKEGIYKMVTLEELKGALPPRQKKLVTQGVVDTLNQLATDEGEEFAEHYKQNFISMSTVMNNTNYNMGDYVSAVKFTAYKLLEHTDIDAYKYTFPDRYQRLMDKWEGLPEEDIRGQKISPFVTAYKKTELAVKVMERSLVPSRILNAPMFQDALNIQMSLAMGARSEMVRQAAAESVMKYTVSPEAQKIELEVGIKGQDEVMALRDEMRRLASQQQAGIEDGSVTSTEVAHSKLLHEVIDVEAE